jgi:hypothetical protein
VVKRELPSPRRESNPRTPIVQPVAQRYIDWATTALLEAVKRKIPSLRRESKPRTPTVQPVAQSYTDWAVALRLADAPLQEVYQSV